MGLALVLTNSQYQEVEMSYGGGDAPTNLLKEVSFTLTQTLPQPVFLYYGLRSYYQNHRRYIKFFSTDQMNGMEISTETVNKFLFRQAPIAEGKQTQMQLLGLH